MESYTIISKRSEYVKMGKALQLGKFRDAKLAFTDKDLLFSGDLIKAFIDFVSYSIYSGSDIDEEFDGIRELNKLDQIFNHDRRKLFLALQNTLHYFFSNLLDDFDSEAANALDKMWSGSKNRPNWWKKAYLSIEGWMLDGRQYHFPRYRFVTHCGDQSETKTGSLITTPQSPLDEFVVEREPHFGPA